MIIINAEDFTEKQLEALREVGNMGAKQASEALSMMIMQSVVINVPSVNVISIAELRKLVGEHDEMVLGAYFKITGEAQGDILMTFSKEQALYLSNTLLGKNNDQEFITEEKRGAMQELGNILASAYLTALSTRMKINLLPSIPHISYDKACVVADFLQKEMARAIEYAVVIETEFEIKGKSIAGNFFAFFEPESSSKILNALGVKD